MILYNAKLDVNAAIMRYPPDKRESCNLLSVIMHNNYIKGIYPLREKEREEEKAPASYSIHEFHANL